MYVYDVVGESDALTDDDDEDVVTPRDDEMDVTGTPGVRIMLRFRGAYVCHDVLITLTLLFTEEMQKQLSMAASQDEPTEEPGSYMSQTNAFFQPAGCKAKCIFVQF